MSPSELLFRQRWAMKRRETPSGGFSLPADFVAEQGASVHLIDVRSREEATGVAGHIPGAVVVPAAELDAALRDIDRDLPIVLVSRSGETASIAAKRLTAAGLTHVAALEGGMIAWKLMGYAISRDPVVLRREPRWMLAAHAGEQPDRVLPSGRRVLSRAQIETHLGDPLSVRWIRMAALMLHGKISCVDGRDERGVVGTPGGDAGEFLLVVAAAERVTGHRVEGAELAALLELWADTFGRFYMHTDVHAIDALHQSMLDDPALRPVVEGLEGPARRRFLLGVPERLRERTLEHLVQAGHLGCGHLRLMSQHPEDYGVRPGLVAEYLRAFYRLWWSGNPELTMTALGGGHEEGAVVNVQLEQAPLAFSSVPMISPMCIGTQMFVNHPQVAGFLRAQVVALLTRELAWLSHDDAVALDRALDELAARQLSQTLGHLARELPLYEVSFARDRSFRVTEA